MQHFISENFKHSDPLYGYTECPQCGATYFQPKGFLKNRTPACCFAVQNLVLDDHSTSLYIGPQLLGWSPFCHIVTRLEVLQLQVLFLCVEY